jgi:hypothetical protein
MIRFVIPLVAALLASLLSGCEPPAVSSSAVSNAPPGPPSPPAAAPEHPNEMAAAPAVNEPTAAVENQPAVPVSTEPTIPPPNQSQQPSPEAASSRFISLAAGVAVPQLLPDGTQIGVSVDYTLSGSPKSSCRYLLVVESKEGEIPVPVTLDPKGGTFQGFLPLTVRPEHQPFRARIEEVDPQGSRAQVSNSAVLATSY